jgi:hypothetical protein
VSPAVLQQLVQSARTMAIQDAVQSAAFFASVITVALACCHFLSTLKPIGCNVSFLGMHNRMFGPYLETLLRTRIAVMFPQTCRSIWSLRVYLGLGQPLISQLFCRFSHIVIKCVPN